MIISGNSISRKKRGPCPVGAQLDSHRGANNFPDLDTGPLKLADILYKKLTSRKNVRAIPPERC